MGGKYYLCRALEKMCHLQVPLSSQASVEYITSKRHTCHLQVTDNFEGKKNISRRYEKQFSHLRKNVTESRCAQKRCKTKKWRKRNTDNEDVAS